LNATAAPPPPPFPYPPTRVRAPMLMLTRSKAITTKSNALVFTIVTYIKLINLFVLYVQAFDETTFNLFVVRNTTGMLTYL
jgi:hypothetical protein